MNKSVSKKVLVGLSGGVDSAVSAYLLKKQGYQVEGVFMKNWSDTTGLVLSDCPWLQDRREALKVAAFLGIPLHTVDFEQQYQDRVMSYFFREYAAGRTPNPDVMCNKEIKFKLMYDWAMEHGFEFLATGHYAQIAQVGSRQSAVVSKTKKARKSLPNDLRLTTYDLRLARSADEFKDQTYFIYNIKTEQLPHVLFPIGGYKKDQVKKLAEKIGLPNAKRKESMGICFVGKVRLKEFLEQKIKAKPGVIKDTDGAVLGKHKGLWNFTLGQRHGIELPDGPWYVAAKNLKTNELVVTKNPKDESLEVESLEISDTNWITKPESAVFTCKARVRHQGELVSVRVGILDGTSARITFRKKQTAIASGQSVVLYQDNCCIGGGVVT